MLTSQIRPILTFDQRTKCGCVLLLRKVVLTTSVRRDSSKARPSGNPHGREGQARRADSQGRPAPAHPAPLGSPLGVPVGVGSRQRGHGMTENDVGIVKNLLHLHSPVRAPANVVS